MRSALPLTALRTFEVSARHLSLRLAAVELGVTPAAVSQQIAHLEGLLGRDLFVRLPRGPRRLRLTDEGSIMSPPLTALFDQLEHLVEKHFGVEC